MLNPATTSHFQVSVGSPSRADGTFNRFLRESGVNFDQDQLNISCSDASLPGSRLATSEILNDFPGVRERHAYRRLYDDAIQLSFYTDADQYLPIRYFEAWMNYITNTTNQNDPNFNGGVEREGYFYRVKFPREYRGSLEITKFEKNLDERRKTKTLTYKFVNCFPLAINSMPLSYDGSNLLKCTVGMAYSRYFIEDKPAGIIPNFINALSRGVKNGRNRRNRRDEIQALRDDTGLSRNDAAIIQSGGFVETLIE